MNLNEFKVNDIIRVTFTGCMRGTGQVTEVADDKITFIWHDKEFAHDCLSCDDIFGEVTKEDFERDIVDELVLLERRNTSTVYGCPSGMIRRVDDLGRIVIPKVIRRAMNIQEADPMEFFCDYKNGVVILQPYRPQDDKED